MANRKTMYTVACIADLQMVNQTVMNWLSANGFEFVVKSGYKYYKSGNALISACRCFEYYFQGNQLIIYAYLRSPNNPFPLDNGMVGVVQTAPYVSIIEQLVNAITGLNGQMQQPQYQQAMGQGTPYYNENVQNNNGYATTQTASYAKPITNQNATCASLSLFMSFACLFMGLMGNLVSVFVIAITIYLGILGLKSEKKTKSVIALAITGIGVILVLLIACGVINSIL